MNKSLNKFSDKLQIFGRSMLLGISAYNNVADLFADEMVNDREKAEEFYLVAEGIFESILKIKAIISVKKNLATTYDNIGNLYSNWKEDEAYSYYLKSIEIKEEVLGLNSSREEIIDLATSTIILDFYLWIPIKKRLSTTMKRPLRPLI